MKRTPLSRRTPLAAMSRKRQQQKKRLAWNSTIASVSVRRRRENRKRSTVLAELRAESDGICPICRDEPAVDGHELLARSAGGSITDKENIRLIGRKCHDYITHNADGVRWATDNGWKLSRYGREKSA